MKKHLSCLAAICLLLTFGLGPATIMAETESAVETETPTELQEEVQSPAEAEATTSTADNEEGKQAENMSENKSQAESQSQKDFQLNEEFQGFVLTRIEDLPDIASTAYFFTHQKSGAEVLWLKNDDPFKVFATCYKTEPGDNGGEAHIVEHALLGGSRKYHSNDIFTDMYSISTNAFMNAMTYPDKTIFPVSSRDPKDFYNLVDVYLDSVFYPQITEDKRIFEQEGWHHEIFDKNDPIEYVGVVYNEMRGAMSDPISLLFDEVGKSIFPDTTYAFNSGGAPDAIPKLSYEDFLKFYHRFYNSSNVLLYFYGDVDMPTYLAHMDEEYLSHFDKSEDEFSYKQQEALKKQNEVETVYNIDADEDPSGKTYLSYNIYAGEGGNLLDYFMLQIVSDVLCDSNESPIKTALFDAGIGEDNGSFWLAYNQNSFGVVAINAEAEQKDQFKEIVEGELKKAAEKGLDPDMLEASINKWELAMREANNNNGIKGLDYLDLILDSRNYGGDALAYLKFTDIFKELREAAKNGGFQEYVKKYLVDSPFSSLIVMKPEPGLEDKKAVEVEKELAAYKDSLSEDELGQLIAENEANKKFKEERQENNLPTLKLDEIDKDINSIDYNVENLGPVTLLHAPQNTGKIIYANLQFDLSTIDLDKLPYAALLTRLLGNLDTEKFSRGELENEIYKSTGGIRFSTFNAEHVKSGEQDARFIMSGKATAENLEKLFALMEEIIFRTSFEDTKWLSQKVSGLRYELENSLVNDGSSTALQRVRSYFSPMFKYREQLSGLDFLKFVQKLDEQLRNEPEAAVKMLTEVYQQLFNQNQLIIGVTSDEEDYEIFKKELQSFLDQLPKEEKERDKFFEETENLQEGISTASQVNYVAKAGSLKKALGKLPGSAKLISNILENLYLYPELRAKRGAYGAYSLVDNYGNFLQYTYRDPNIAESMKVFDGAGDFLSQLDLDEADLEQLIIGYFKAYPLPPETTAEQICYRYINGLSNDDYLREAEEVAATDLKTIQSYGPVLKKLMEDNELCVVGNSVQIEKDKELFKAVVKLLAEGEAAAENEEQSEDASKEAPAEKSGEASAEESSYSSEAGSAEENETAPAEEQVTESGEKTP